MNEKVNSNNSSNEDKPLTKKEELFCELYLKHGCNATAAYREWKPNAKESTAMVEGWRMLRKPNIRVYIDKLQEDLKESYKMSTEVMIQMRMRHLDLMLKGTEKGYYDGVQKKTVTYIERDNRAINEEYAALERLFGLDKPKEINVNVGPDPVHTELLEALQNVKIEGVDDVDGNTETNTDSGSST